MTFHNEAAEVMTTARIVAITQPRVEGIKTAEEFVVYAARASNPANQKNMKTGEKLLKYCYNKKHFSIFEMVNIVMEIETTRDIGRQILRHSFRFQEFSQRYADPVNHLGFQKRQARLQDDKNRQNSLETDDEQLEKWWSVAQARLIDAAESMYKNALAKGIAKEQARAVLPEGLTMTRMYMNGTLRQWIHYLAVRLDPSTQKEHRQLAEMMRKELVQEFPSLRLVMGM